MDRDWRSGVNRWAENFYFGFKGTCVANLNSMLLVCLLKTIILHFPRDAPASTRRSRDANSAPWYDAASKKDKRRGREKKRDARKYIEARARIGRLTPTRGLTSTTIQRQFEQFGAPMPEIFLSSRRLDLRFFVRRVIARDSPQSISYH